MFVTVRAAFDDAIKGLLREGARVLIGVLEQGA